MQFFYGQSPTNGAISILKGGTYYPVISDPVTGSVRFILDSQGNIMQQISYDGYGNMVRNTNPTFQPLGFAGGLFDRDTKLTHFGARDYSSQTGRWLTKDPLAFGGGDSNLYSYVGNDPINKMDPGGLDTTGLGGTFSGSFLGAAGSFSTQIVFDDHGKMDIAITTCGGGATPNLSGSFGATVSGTTANSITDLDGKSTSVYGSAGLGLTGASYSTSSGPATPKCPSGTSGSDFTFGLSLGLKNLSIPKIGLVRCNTKVIGF